MTSTMALASHLLAVAAVAAVSTFTFAVGSRATPETLYNGIVLPTPWPPADIALTHRTVEPWYLRGDGHPSAVIVDVGRQLFVDSFLLEPTLTNATVTFHAPRLEQAPGARVGGGGLWFDSTARVFKSFFECSSAAIDGDGALGPVCLATSDDGVQWQAQPARMVLNSSAFSRAVLLDELAAPGQRWKMAQVELGPSKTTSDLRYQLYASGDGLTWSRQTSDLSRPGIGSPGDCSSAFCNPFRNVTVLSSKATDVTLGRHREYAESGVFFEEAFGAAPLVPWAAADARDPRWLGDPFSGHVNHTTEDFPELYNLDAVAYESIMLGQFRIFRCKEHYQGCAVMYNSTACALHPKNKGCTALSHELADILLGFSRDGFSWSRTPIAQPVPAEGFELTADRRFPFVGQELGGRGWNSQGIGSVVGGLAIVGKDRQHESLRLFYTSGSSGVGILRRDGFASVGSLTPDRGAVLVTVPLIFQTQKERLFLNLIGGLRALAIVEPGGGAHSQGGPPLLSAEPLPRSTNSTMVELAMKAGAVSGESRFGSHLSWSPAPSCTPFG